ncbi:integrase arm-type DNA-binding domain-containing protein [Photobacterium damselae subsp. damselae]|uniref:tyrosine-type recombinase/integrase n=1 Tax=Photobacterium damselae TaxID=38293 RepID=UPI00311B3517
MFTVSEIKGLKPKANPYYVWDSDQQRGNGKLGVQVTPKGSKRFVFRYFVNKKAKFIQIGSFPELSLARAREKAKEFSSILQEGLDPKAELEAAKIKEEQKKREESQKGSLEELINSYVDKLRLDGKRSGDRILNAIATDVYPSIDKTTKAKEITPNDIRIVLAKMIQRGAAAHSNKIRSYLHAAFNFGLRHDYDPANYSSIVLFGLAYNPVSLVPKQTHAEHVGENWLKKEDAQQLISVKSAEYFVPDVFILLRLCFFLGGQRPNEIAASKWSAVDFNNHTFEITSDVSKNYRANLIPLTDTAMQLFRELYSWNGNSEYLFPRLTQSGHLEASYFSKVIRKYCLATDFPKFVPRDIRRTVKTLMGQAKIDKSIRDRLQNHALNDVSSKHYDRYDYFDEKKKALEVWEEYLI